MEQKIGKEEIMSDVELCQKTIVQQQIDKVIEIAKTCNTMEELKSKLTVYDKEMKRE